MFDPMFDDDGGQPTEPLTSSEFKETIVSEFAAIADGVGIDESIGAAVDSVWPVVSDHTDTIVARRDVDEANIAPTVGVKDDYQWFPSYRENQRRAVVDILHKLYVDDNSVVTLSAPTGAGKSLILHGVMKTLDSVFGKSDPNAGSGQANSNAVRGDAFFSTPLNSLIDQINNDEFISDDVVTLKGKNNYQCVHRQDRGAPVDTAICQRVSDFECEHKNTSHEAGGCPYYGRKHVAQTHPEVVTNLSYLMANSMIPDEHGLSERELVVVDECQNIEDFALNFVGITVSERTVPCVWEQIEQPPQTENVDQLAEWLENEVMLHVQRKLDEFEARAELNEAEADDRDDLEEFARKVSNFLNDVAQHHWVAEHDYDNHKVSFEPIFVGRFLDRFLWSQGHKVVLSSATIPKGGFLEEVGLEERQVGSVEVESTFPPERRVVDTDDAVGKMTQSQRSQTTPKMAQKIGDIADHHSDHKGFVHCHSYDIMKDLYDALPPAVRERTRMQDRDERTESLDAWLDADVDERGFGDDEGGQIFLSVSMDEGISLDGDAARWQIVAKAAYPYMKAKRVEYRMDELNDWNWYAGSAAIDLQQAVGRAMRSKDDWCINYILDKSAVQLMERNEYLFEDWYLEAVDVESDS